jgi:hypothetical protein
MKAVECMEVETLAQPYGETKNIITQKNKLV